MVKLTFGPVGGSFDTSLKFNNNGPQKPPVMKKKKNKSNEFLTWLAAYDI
jgi:hypothetical protein